MFSNDFVTTPFSHSSCYSHPLRQKFYQFVQCLRFYDGLFTRVFSSHTRLQSVDNTERAYGLFPFFSHFLFLVGALVSAGLMSGTDHLKHLSGHPALNSLDVGAQAKVGKLSFELTELFYYSFSFDSLANLYIISLIMQPTKTAKNQL